MSAGLRVCPKNRLYGIVAGCALGSVLMDRSALRLGEGILMDLRPQEHGGQRGDQRSPVLATHLC